MTARLRAPDRRRQLLDAALPCFARGGYQGTTTAQLAEAAGITPPILYRHFDGKLDLYATLLDEAAERLVGAWEARLARTRDPRRRAAVLVDAVARSWHDPERKLILRAMTEAEDDPVIGAGVQRCLRRIYGLVASELRALQAAGTVRTDVAPAQLARRLVSAAVGATVTSAGARTPRPGPARWLEALVAPRGRRSRE